MEKGTSSVHPAVINE